MILMVGGNGLMAPACTHGGTLRNTADDHAGNDGGARDDAAAVGVDDDEDLSFCKSQD